MNKMVLPLGLLAALMLGHPVQAKLNGYDATMIQSAYRAFHGVSLQMRKQGRVRGRGYYLIKSAFAAVHNGDDARVSEGGLISARKYLDQARVQHGPEIDPLFGEAVRTLDERLRAAGH